MNPTPRPNPVLLALLAAAFAPQAFADNPADTPADSQNSPQAAAESAFTLGEITVRGRRDTAADESVVRAADIRRSNSRDIAQALATQPSVSIDFSGGRNETGIRVRGFDARQVPLFLDGIPQYVPYDGYVDFARFPTPGLAEIRTAKAGASLMYGFNTMGGAINLVTRKPQKAFEGSAQVGLDDSSGRNVSLNLGSATERFYVQGGFAYLHQNRFRLPKDFSDLKARPTDTGRYRENAGRTDRHYSLKFGLTPNETDEYALGYSGIRSEKQQPVYTGDAPNSQARYWRWPYWDKDSFYFIGNTALGQANRLKVRLYHDSYKNGMQSYTDSSYTTPDAALSPYKDRTLGASVNFSTTAFQNQLLQFGYQYKTDRHHDQEKETRFRDAAHQFALEHQIDFTPQWRLRSSADYEHLAAKELPAGYQKGKTHSVNGLIELSYRPVENQMFYTTVSGKSRFPSIKDRYSFRMGRAIPNPDLKSERAHHIEIGWKGQPWQGAQAEAAVFYSRLRNEIQNTLVPEPTRNACRRSGTRGYCNQAQNIGRTRHTGAEISLRQNIGSQWTLGLGYGYLNRKDLDGGTVLTGTPVHKADAFAEYRPSRHLTLAANARLESGRRSAYGSSTRKLGGYAVYDAKAIWNIRDGLSWEIGLDNITDKKYELTDGYPMPGRSWYTNLRYTF